MTATTLDGVLLKGTAASRPSASAVAKGTIYSATDTGAITQSDGVSTWSTFATITAGAMATDVLWDAAGDLAQGTGANTGAKLSAGTAGKVLTSNGAAAALTWETPSAGASLPGWVSAFVGTTDSTHFYWDGNDLASFTTQTVTGTATWSEGQNLASVLLTGQTADDVAGVLIAQTISTGDAWTVPVKVPLASHTSAMGASRSVGIIMTDGTTTTSNVVAGHLQVANTGGASFIMVGRHGTMTAISTAPWVSENNYAFDGWIYIKLIYQASNTFRLQFSPDGVTYSAFGEADISKTMTPTHVGIAGWNPDAGTALATFGPLKKV